MASTNVLTLQHYQQARSLKLCARCHESRCTLTHKQIIDLGESNYSCLAEMKWHFLWTPIPSIFKYNHTNFQTSLLLLFLINTMAHMRTRWEENGRALKSYMTKYIGVQEILYFIAVWETSIPKNRLTLENGMTVTLLIPDILLISRNFSKHLNKPSSYMAV